MSRLTRIWRPSWVCWHGHVSFVPFSVRNGGRFRQLAWRLGFGQIVYRRFR